MRILGIDTSDGRGGVALRDDGRELAALLHSQPVEYSSWLLPAVQGLLDDSGWNLRDVDAFAISTGPGSFTGLRVGLTTVKAWAEVFCKPLMGIGRLEALASRANTKSGYIATCYDAQRGHLFGALYAKESGKLNSVESEIVASPDAFLNLVAQNCNSHPAQWVSLDPELITTLPAWKERQSLGDAMLLSRSDLVSSIAELGEQRAIRSQFTDPLLLDANYVRRPDAELFWKDPVTYAG